MKIEEDEPWKVSRNGNRYRFIPPAHNSASGENDQVVTVFLINNGRNEGKYKWVCDGEFSEEAFLTEEEAMEDAEDNFGIE